MWMRFQGLSSACGRLCRPWYGLALLGALALLPACGEGRASAEVGTEGDRIVELMTLEAGMRVADVGAGAGAWSKVLAEAVGPDGLVYATEVAAGDLAELRSLAEDFWLQNIRVVEGTATDTGLGAGCCDAILLRLVYHHFTDPAAMRVGLRRALRPGAPLVVIDIRPQEDWDRLEGVPERGGHGISIEALIAEMSGDGFEAVARYPDWPGEEDYFCVVFRRGGEVSGPAMR